MTTTEKKQLEVWACKVRMGIIQAVRSAGSGYTGGPLSSADLLAALCFKEMNTDPNDPQKADRDRFILSESQCAPVLRAALANRSLFPSGDVLCSGIEVSVGSPGVSMAVGMALAARYQEKDCRIYVLLNDSEAMGGPVWEALLLAHHYKLDNLCVIFNQNRFRTGGRATGRIDLLPEKLRAFGFQIEEADGHDFESLEQAFRKARETEGAPSAIIARTVSGKGVSFMENEVTAQAIDDSEYGRAMAELDARLTELEAE